LTDLTSHLNGALVPVYDSEDRGEAQAEPFAIGLGGKKRFKNVRQAFLGNAAARVADSDFHDVQPEVESAGKDKGPSVRHGVNSVE
jgi:hypothetical protein